jgi:hypothetical protein
MKTVKRLVQSFRKTQLNATIKPETFRPAITQKRTSANTQYEDRTNLPPHLQRPQVVPFPRRLSLARLQGRNKRAKFLPEQPY